MTNDFRNYENCLELENQCDKKCSECENIISWIDSEMMTINDLCEQMNIEDYCQREMRKRNDYPSIAVKCKKIFEKLESELRSKYTNIMHKEAILNDQF